MALSTARLPHDAPATARVVPVDGAGVALVSWDLPGEHRVAISRDGGRTWRPSEAMDYRIPLRAGVLEPGLRAPAVPARLAAGPGDRLFIVQFEAKGVEGFRRLLRGMGVELLSYLPRNAWIVRMDAELAEEVAAQPFVRWVGPYAPGYKLEPEIAAELSAAHAAAPARRYHLMTFAPGPEAKRALAADVRAAGGKVVLDFPDGYRIDATLDAGQLERVARSTRLAWVDRWSAPENDMDVVRAQCGADYVESVAGYAGQGVRGEVMDCGVMSTHPDFDDTRIHGPGANECEHGTAAYGIVFGNGDRDGDGEARATGLLPAAQGYFYDYDNLGNRYQATAELVAPPMNVVFQSNSWGDARTTAYTSISQELDDIAWQYDIAIFQSQSNSGTRASRPQAWSKNVISVGGVYHRDTLSPSDDCWCSGASIGPAEDGRVKPDLVHWYDFIYCPDLEPGGYDPGLYTPTFAGTSASTPIVAGIGGLFFQMWADDALGTGPSGDSVFARRPHAMTIKALLINTADAYPFSGASSDLSRPKQGWGLPSARNLYDRRQRIKVVDEEHVLREDDVHTYAAAVPAGEPALKVTLAYMDRAGTAAATLHRINDVSIQVIDPAGAVKYHGNVGLNYGNWSNPGGSPNHVDTVENVFVQNPAPGTWSIRVLAEEINLDEHVETPEVDQDYALVVSGVTSLALSPPHAPGGLGPAGLVVARDGKDVRLTWSADCGGGTSFSVYRGDLAQGWASAAPVPGACALAGLETVLAAAPSSEFFLVAPNDGTFEGSLGVNGAGAPRPQPAAPCMPRAPQPNLCAP